MIEAHFDAKMGRTALITGAYQYDVGQRLRLSGLPSPDELAAMDDFLSGDIVTVMVHFSRKGDSQSDTRLAMWDGARSVWLVSVPDEYLTRHIAVYVQVFVYYGTDGEDERGKTMYEGVFTPSSRSAPSNVVTDEQRETWSDKEQEVQLVLVPLGNATENAKQAADGAVSAADAAERSAASAQEAEKKAQEAQTALAEFAKFLSSMNIRVVTVPTGEEAKAVKNGNQVTLSVPTGKDGGKGETGDKGPGDVEFSYDSTTGTLTITTK